MSILKKLAGQTLLYGLSSMLGRALNFLLVPFYTSVLVVSEFGVYTELYAYVAFFNIVYLFGMETTYFRFANKDTLGEVETYRNIQSFIIFLAVFLSGILIVFSTSIASVLEYSGKENYILWIALIMGVDAIIAIPFARLRQESKAGYFAFSKLSNIGLNIGLNLFFLVFCKNVYEGNWMPSMLPFVEKCYAPGHEIEYIFISNFIANAMMIPLLWKHFAVFRVRWNFSQLKPLLIYAYPLMFMGLAGMTNEVLDRILLKPLLPLDLYPGLSKEAVLGIYGGCYKLSMFMTLAIQSFRYAADPFFFSKAEDKKAPELFAKVMSWFVVTCCFIFLVVSLYADTIGRLVLRQDVFLTGLAVVPVLLLANLFLGVYYNLSIWYKLTDKTYWGTWISVGGAVFTILGNLLLIPLIGYMGAAYTTLGCYFLMAAVSYGLGNKYFKVPYNVLSIGLLVLGSILLVILERNFPLELFWQTQFFRLGLLVVFFVLIFALAKKKLL